MKNNPLNNPLTGAICIKIKEKLIKKYQRCGNTGSIQKQPSSVK